MKVETSKLSGRALDWAVIVAEHGKHDPNNPDHVAHFKQLRSRHQLHPLHQQARYSERWDHGGPIIDREHICTFHYNSDDDGQPCEPGWTACIHRERMSFGPTALIAAMRSWVDYKLGPTVEIPDELMKEPDEG
jgi:hypothetical protein